MSLNVSGSRYVRVYDTNIKLQVSDRIVFARLSTSRKTGNDLVDKETGAIIIDDNGNAVQERKYSTWEGRFVGNAFEPSKGLAAGQAINIINGWIVNEPYTRKDKSTGYSQYVTIADFTVVDENEPGEAE